MGGEGNCDCDSAFGADSAVPRSTRNKTDPKKTIFLTCKNVQKNVVAQGLLRADVVVKIVVLFDGLIDSQQRQQLIRFAIHTEQP